MAWRFRQRIRIAKGVHLNVSKTGVSTSFGGPGATVNVGRGETKATLGLPGTGLSTEHTLIKAKRGRKGKAAEPVVLTTKDWLLAAAFIVGLILVLMWIF